MLNHDRVYCDCCGQMIGQLFGIHYSSTPAIPDKTKPPHFALCNSCLTTMNSRNVSRSTASSIGHLK